MYAKVSEKIRQLPPEYPQEMLPLIRQEFLKTEKTIVVLDDDPTGTQTCYDVTVLTSWRSELIVEELMKKPSILFVLTNSRSLPEAAAIELTLEIGRNVKEASRQSGRDILIISRSDSTLRGHFPAEVDAIAASLDMRDAVRILIPAFIEGGRFTIDDVHYLVENGELVPVSDTPFARDVVFGYANADLKLWVEEKTKGSINARDVVSISLDDIRVGGPAAVAEKLERCQVRNVCIVNAVSYRDLEVFALGVMSAENAGRKFLYRSSATLVPLRAGLASGKSFTAAKELIPSNNGSLVIVGSHVPKTTRQLAWLLEHSAFERLEVNVEDIIHSGTTSSLVESVTRQTDQWIAAGKDVVIYTSRTLEVGHDSASNLKINAEVSDVLVGIVKGLTVRPKFMVAKGGITSSDLATRGLSSEKATVLGAIIPGVPVWKMDINSRFPGILYVVFPGNVGDEKALMEVCTRLNG